MFKIGEFSKLTQVSIRMLRYCDQMDLLKPAKVNRDTGYRMYSMNQIKILNRILFLRDAGFTVKEIKEVLDSWNDDLLKEELMRKVDESKAIIKAEKDKINKIEIAINELNNEEENINCNVIVKRIPSYNVISLRKIIRNYFDECYLWEELCNFIINEQLNINELHSFAIYHDKEYKEENVDVEVCIVTDFVGENKDGITFRKTEEFDTVATTMIYGPYYNIDLGYREFVKWLEKNNQYSINGINMQVCHKGPWNETNSKDYLTEIQIPVKIKE